MFFVAFVPTYGPVVWLYMAEILQPHLVAIGSMLIWIWMTLTVGFFPIIREHYCTGNNCPEVFGFFAACMALSFVVIWWLMVESKDKTEL